MVYYGSNVKYITENVLEMSSYSALHILSRKAVNERGDEYKEQKYCWHTHG